ncbi:hypothetical protein JCM6882_000648 [Rhodosporidiobolus microsporus]
MLKQDLIDRLVTAVEEEDVVYTVFWLKEMQKEGLLDEDNGCEGVHLRHSWKQLTALEAAAKLPPSPYQLVICELLLLQTRNSSQIAVLELTIGVKKQRVSEKLDEWKTRQWDAGSSAPEISCSSSCPPSPTQRSSAEHAKHLFDLEPVDAADYYDANFPRHPREDEMTGNNPPPRAPSFPKSKPLSTTPAGSPTPRHIVEQDFPRISTSPPPPSTASAPMHQVSSAFVAPPAHLPKPPPAPTCPPYVRVFFNNLPLDSTVYELQGLLAPTGIIVRDIEPAQIGAIAHRASFTGTVQHATDYERLVVALHQSTLRSCTIFLNRTRPVKTDPTHPYVRVHNLPPNADSSIRDLAKRAACGAYDFGWQPAGDGATAVGWFRVESVTLAVLAVRYITGQRVQAAVVRAEWLPAVSPAAQPVQQQPVQQQPVQQKRTEIVVSAPSPLPTTESNIAPAVAPAPPALSNKSPSRSASAASATPSSPGHSTSPSPAPEVEIIDLTADSPPPDSSLPLPLAPTASTTFALPSSTYPSPELTPLEQGTPSAEAPQATSFRPFAMPSPGGQGKRGKKRSRADEEEKGTEGGAGLGLFFEPKGSEKRRRPSASVDEHHASSPCVAL